MNDTFKKGFYFPALAWLLAELEKCSLNFWVKRYIKERGFTDVSGEKAPPWVSELYQLLFLSIGFLFLVLASESTKTLVRWGLTVVLVYRLLEILVFTLNWIFVHSVPVHRYRRSIAGFMFNVFELGLYVSVISVLADCFVSSAGKYSLLYDHMRGILALDLPQLQACAGCQLLSGLELLISALLLLVVLAGLVGAILREQVDRE